MKILKYDFQVPGIYIYLIFNSDLFKLFSTENLKENI